MKFSEALKHAEDLLEGVSAAGAGNWNRLSDSVRIIRAVRMQIEVQEKEAEQRNGSDENGSSQRDPENTAGTI
jgi:hypothetical protein